MKCGKCGRELSATSNFCRICGTPVDKAIVNDYIDKKETLYEIEKKAELTGNIDVSKIIVEKDNSVEEFDDEIVEKTEDLDKKIEAMIEISRPENVNNKSASVLKNSELFNLEKERDSKECCGSTSELKIDSTPGEVCDIKLHTTKELEDMIALEHRISHEPAEKLPLDVVGNDISIEVEDSESTMLIPDSLKDVSIKKEVITDEQHSTIDEKVSNNELFVDNKDVVFAQKTDVVALSKEETSNKIVADSNEIFSNMNLENDFSRDFLDDKKNKKTGKLLCVSLVFLLIISFCGIGYLYMLYTNNQNEVKMLNDEKKKILIENKRLQREDSNSKTKNNLFYNGYLFEINKDISYNVLDEIMLIEKNDNKFFITLGKEVEFGDIKDKMDDYKDLLEEQDLSVETYGTKMVEERSYVVFEVNNEDNNLFLVAYTKISASDSVGIVVSSLNDKIDYSCLNEFNDILNSVKTTDDIDNLQLNVFENGINE